MNIYERQHDKKLLDEIELYISFAEDAYTERKPYIITEAHEAIKKSNYENEYEYYSDLTDYIIEKLYKKDAEEEQNDFESNNI